MLLYSLKIRLMQKFICELIAYELFYYVTLKIIMIS